MMRPYRAALLVTLFAVLMFPRVSYGQGTLYEPIMVDNADQLIQIARFGRGTVSHLSWSADGKTLAVAGSIGMWLYDVTAFDDPPQLLESANGCLDAAFSPNGSLLACGDDSALVQVWDVQTGQIQRVLKGHQPGQYSSRINTVDFNPDGSLLASGGDDGTIRLWDITMGEPKFVLKQPKEKSVTDLAFSPDGKILVAASDDRIGLDTIISAWNVKTGALRAFREDVVNNISGIGFSPDSKTAIYSGYGTIMRWNMREKPIPVFLIPDKVGGRSGVYYGFDLDSTGTVIALGLDNGVIQLWNWQTRTNEAILKAPNNVTTRVAFQPNGNLLASVGDDNIVRIWNLTTGKEQYSFTHTYPLTAVAFQTDEIVVGTHKFYDPSCRGCDSYMHTLWDVKTGNVVKVFNGYKRYGSVDRIDKVFNPDATLALLIERPTGKMSVLDAQTDKLIAVMDYSSRLDRYAFSPDRTLLALEDYGNLNLWDLHTGKLRVRLAEHHFGWNLVFSPDSSILVSDDSSFGVHFWNTRTGKELATSGGSQLYDVAFSPDSRLVAGVSYRYIHIWDSRMGKQLQALAGHSDAIRGAAFNSDGTLLASASDDGTVRLWDVTTGEQLTLLDNHHGSTAGVAFSPDGTLLASIGNDGTLRLWGIENQ